MQSATSNLYTTEICDQEIVVEARLRGEVMIKLHAKKEHFRGDLCFESVDEEA